MGNHKRNIVGTNLNNIVRERSLDPDVVIPRRRWPRGQPELRSFLARGVYETEALPVRDIHFNNIPALSRSRSTPDVHRFRTATPDDDDARLEIFWRRSREPDDVAVDDVLVALRRLDVQRVERIAHELGPQLPRVGPRGSDLVLAHDRGGFG